jgi:lipoprotein NlpD
LIAVRKAVVFVLASLCLSGCVHPGQPVVAERSPVFDPLPQVPVSGGGNVRVYTVRKTDTLYSIAWRFQLEYRGFARANGISAPYTIYPGQKLRLVTQYPGQVTAAKPTRPQPTRPQGPPPAIAKPKAAHPGETTRWVWPLSTQPRDEFSGKSKGMNFVIAPGSSANVRVIGAGQVVYAGNGIGGFEQLIIVKHTAELLSAYGFNGRRRVAEQQWVKAGDIVADIVNTGRKTQTLHFEVRREGAPMNPRKLLR